MPPCASRTYSPKRVVNEALQTVQMHLNQEFVGHVDFPAADGHVHRFVYSSVDYPRVNKETTRSHIGAVGRPNRVVGTVTIHLVLKHRNVARFFVW